MSNFKSFTDMNGDKVRLGDSVEVIAIDNQTVRRVGKVMEILNEVFAGITISVEGYGHGRIKAKRCRKLNF